MAIETRFNDMPTLKQPFNQQKIVSFLNRKPKVKTSLIKIIQFQKMRNSAIIVKSQVILKIIFISV